MDGLCLETLPSNGDEFPRSLSVQIDEHDIRHEQYAQRAILSLEHEVEPALYSPDGETSSFPELLPRPAIRNPELSSVSMDGLCRAMSIETNSYVDWFRQWWGLWRRRRLLPQPRILVCQQRHKQLATKPRL